MKSAPAIAFEYQPSRWLAACLVVVWLIALSALVACGLPAWLKVMLGFAASLYAAWALRDFLRPPCRHLLWHDAGHWRLSKGADEAHVAELEHAVMRGGWIVLTLRRTDGKCMALVLAPDNCDSDIRRRLRVRLARV